MKRARRLHRPSFRVEISGGIASGKTTLAKLLTQGTQWTLVRENFRRNPFLAKFYAEPARFMHEKNVCFMPLHTGAIKARSSAQAVVCDYAVFQNLAYARLSKSNEHIAAMDALYVDLYCALPAPVLFIHLECAPRIQVERIRARHRREEAAITVGYLRSLNEMIESILGEKTRGSPVKVIRSDRVNFADDRERAAQVKSEIFVALDALSS
jgi:deoxyguanosine kinase